MDDKTLLYVNLFYKVKKIIKIWFICQAQKFANNILGIGDYDANTMISVQQNRDVKLDKLLLIDQF